MTLEEAIKHCEEVADTCESEVSNYDLTDRYESSVACGVGKCGEEHRQLAEWLKELKVYKEQEPKIGRWIIEGAVDCYLEKAKCRCSNCLSKYVFPAHYNHVAQKMYFNDDDKKWVHNYCPNCGKRMIEVTE